jgi:hypothetical protein
MALATCFLGARRCHGHGAVTCLARVVSIPRITTWAGARALRSRRLNVPVPPDGAMIGFVRRPMGALAGGHAYGRVAASRRNNHQKGQGNETGRQYDAG